MQKNIAKDYYFDLVHYQNKTDSFNKPYLVAALDVLGFSNYVLLKKQTNFLYDSAFWVLSSMESIEDELSDDGTSVYARFFSDCIYTFFPLDYKEIDADDFNSFLRKMANLIEIALSNGFLIRGGLCVGECSINRTMMWGPGIIKSHILEEKVADTGRVIIESRDYKQLHNYLKYLLGETKHLDLDNYFKTEENGYYSFDSTKYILEVLYAEMDVNTALARYRRSLLAVEENILDTSTDGDKEKNLSKLSWHLQRYNELASSINQPTLILKTQS